MNKLRARLAPSRCLCPIQGEAWGEGRADSAATALPSRTPTAALPLRGGGSRANPWAERRLALPHGSLVLREAAADAPGLPVLLLHGISSGAGSWDALASALPGRRLLAWDAPGYGQSAALPQRQPSADHCAKVVALILQKLGLRQALLVGHCGGRADRGHAAQGLALMAEAHTLDDAAERYGVPVLERGLRLLGEFSRSERELSPPELARWACASPPPAPAPAMRQARRWKHSPPARRCCT